MQITLKKTEELVTSPKNGMSKNDWEQYGYNFLKFVAPTLGIFFAQLAVGVDWKPASMLALFALYQTISDFFTKWSEKTKEIVEK